MTNRSKDSFHFVKSDWTDFVNTRSVIRHGQIDFTKEVGGGSFGAWWLRGEASRRQGRGGRMQIPEFLCRGLSRGGYLPVRRIKVAVFTIGNADRAAIVLPYKRPPGYMRTRPFFAKHNVRFVVHFFAHHKCPGSHYTRYFVSITCTSWKCTSTFETSRILPLYIVQNVSLFFF